MGKKLTKETFIERCLKKHGNTYDYSKVDFQGTRKKVVIICPKHGEFLQTPDRHMSGTNCPKCSGKYRISTKIFIERSIKIHGDKYDYSKVNYVSQKSNVIIICPVHGEFKQTPGSHIYQKSGCNICGDLKGKIKKSYDKSFIKKSNKVHKNKYNYDKTVYKGSKLKVTITCPFHGEFLQTPMDHLQGYGCRKCSKKPYYDTNSFIEHVKEIHKNKYDYKKVKYISSNSKVVIICPKHGEFLQTPNQHKYYGCKKCGIENTQKKRKLTLKDFIKKSIIIHGDKYDYSEVVYTNYNKPIKIICPQHGLFLQTPGSHIYQKSGCIKCSYELNRKKLILPYEQVLDRFIKKHGKIYEYDEKTYTSFTEKMKITCPIHGDFSITPRSHLKGTGCRKCGYELSGSKNRMSLNDFINKSNKIHQEKYDYSKVNYINSNTKVIIICPKHGEFYKSPIQHTIGLSGCPKCSSSKGETRIRNILINRKIEFEEQKTFDWLKNKSSLRCDFYLKKYNTVIEFNGLQHYENIPFFGGKVGYEVRRKRDKIKRKLLFENNVKLIEVRFDEKDIENYIFNQLSI